MTATIQANSQTYQPFSLPTYEDIKNFMEHGRNDEVDVTSYIGLKPIFNRLDYDETLLKAIPSPPRYKDLIEILHP